MTVKYIEIKLLYLDRSDIFVKNTTTQYLVSQWVSI